MVSFDVAEEVLLRSSVKDILRCKSVCKSWYSLISSPYFVNLHLKCICKKENKVNKQLGNRRIALTKRYIIEIRRDTYRYLTHWYEYHLLDIQGSSNGLVCISAETKICITNPSTREFRKLPRPPILAGVDYPESYGFGYDSFTDDYKFVKLINQDSDGTLVQILSLKSNVWKIFGHVNYRFGHVEPGILFNGALHWFMYHSNHDLFIVSFDLATEEFREIAKLDDTIYDDRHCYKMGIVEDSLCIFQDHLDGRPHFVWVMKNYNVLNPCWELLPTDCEMKDRVHYMVKDSFQSKEIPTYFCCTDTFLSRSGKHIWSPMFVQTLVSPFVNNNNGRPKRAAEEAGSSKERRDLEEVYTLRDGEKNGFHVDKYVLDRERKKRKKRKVMLLYKQFAGTTFSLLYNRKKRGKEGEGGKKSGPRNKNNSQDLIWQTWR